MKQHFLPHWDAIYLALQQGHTVYWKSVAYVLSGNASKGLNIKASTGHIIGVYVPDYNPKDFFTLEEG